MEKSVDLTQWIDSMGAWGPRLMAVVLVVAGGLITARMLQTLVLRWGGNLGIADIQWVAGLVRIAVLLATGLVAVQQLGVDLGLLTTLAGVLAGVLAGSLALALALGARRMVSDILAAYHLKKLYHPGQRLRIGEHEGRLREITATGLLLDSEKGQVHLSGRLAFDSVIVRLKD